MKKILVPTDFSPNADKALDFAVQIARKAKAKIILIHACDLLDLKFKDYSGLKKTYNQQMVRELRAKLSSYRGSIETTEKLQVETKLYEGLVTHTIVEAAKLHKPDLIVMGTLGNAGTKERILGSKTASVIAKVNTPVLAVPLFSEWKDPTNLLLALNNFNEGKPGTVRPLVELAELFSANLTVVKFSEAVTATPHKYLSIERSGNTYVKKLKDAGKIPAASFIHLDGHKFEKNIERFILKQHIDIVAMITHRRNFVKNLFNRSMTRKMSYHTTIPLLALPAPQLPGTRFAPEDQWINKVIL